MTTLNGRVDSSGAKARQRDLRAWALVLGAAAVLTAVAVPVLWNGAPLADEYHLCMRPQHDGGFGPYFADIWADTGVVRPARFIELFLVAGLCDRVPFGAIIIVPLLIKLVGAPLLIGLLRDLRLPGLWPAIGAALWLLEPLGTEAALWPAALHVNLGLVLALISLRMHHRGRFVLGGMAALGACLSVEQAIFALPFAAWLVTPREHRRQAALVTAGICLVVLTTYALWPGENPRQDVSLAQRFSYLFDDPTWYVRFPVVGLGLHSGFVGFLWAFPWSAALVGGLVWAGWRSGPALLRSGTPRDASWSWWYGVTLIAILIGLVNVPLLVTEVGQSPRTFTPSWLVIAAGIAAAGSRLPASRHRLLGQLAGAFTAFAILSLALSAWVRVETVAFNQAAFDWIAERTSDGDVVGLCNIERTAVEPAPAGAFHLHALHSQYGGALEYHAGRVAEMRRLEQVRGDPCPDSAGVDLVVDFAALKAGWARR